MELREGTIKADRRGKGRGGELRRNGEGRGGGRGVEERTEEEMVS